MKFSTMETMKYLNTTALIMLMGASLWSQSVDSLFAINQVDSLLKISKTFIDKQEYEKALELNAAAEKLALNSFGPESSAYGKCCFNHGRILHFRIWVLKDKGLFSEAEKWYSKSESIRKKVLGMDHPDYAKSVGSLGNLYWLMGNYEKAEPLYLESKAIQEKTLGKENLDYDLFIWSLTNLGRLYSDKGQYEKAEPFYLEAKAIREKVMGKEHPEFASSLNGLGNLYLTMGQYEKAEPYYLEAKFIREKILGKDHPDYAWSLNNLASMYWYMGQFEKAESLYLEAYTVRERILGKEHPDFATSLNNLANLYWDMGQYENAEPLYLEAKSIREKALGKVHPDYAGVIINLGSLYRSMGEYEKSASLLLEAKEIFEISLNKQDHPFYFNCLGDLANLYKDKGQYHKAEQLYLETKAIQEKVLGREHPEYSGTLANLGNLNFDMGKYDNAEALYLEAKSIFEMALGKEHPMYAQTLYNLGDLYNILEQYEKAESYYLEASKIDQILITKALVHLSEWELNNYLNQFLTNQHTILSFNQLAGRENVSAACYNNSIFYKGFLLNEGAKIKRLALSNPNSTETFSQLKGCKRLLAKIYSKPVFERDSIQLVELETHVNLLEKELARNLAGFNEARQELTIHDIQKALNPSEAALEFVHYHFYSRKRQTDRMMYAALIIKPGNQHPKFIPLFEEKSIDSLLNAKTERKSDYVNSLYTLVDRGAVAVAAPQKSLYEILWQPLEKELAGISTIYFSPSGLLHRINLNAIPISETETLADKYKLFELNSTRQLVIPTQIKNGNNDAVLYGGIQFEQDTTVQSIEPFIASRSRGELSFHSIDSTLRGGTWNYLAGTEREVNSIEKILQISGVNVSLKKGYQATEESFKNIGASNSPSPRILHIATHGYFFPDAKENEKVSNTLDNKEPVFKISDHPMLRSGLIMAGGNAAWQGKKTLEGREDGILTAYEISQMNLSNTKLVVLSACETGLGDIQGNEGVYGLQRAFKIAGAKYLVMSLWQVPDKQTSRLMTTFYKKWLEDKMSIPDAFHAAQKELREVGLDPYQWAGFVLVE